MSPNRRKTAKLFDAVESILDNDADPAVVAVPNLDVLRQSRPGTLDWRDSAFKSDVAFVGEDSLARAKLLLNAAATGKANVGEGARGEHSPRAPNDSTRPWMHANLKN